MPAHTSSSCVCHVGLIHDAVKHLMNLGFHALTSSFSVPDTQMVEPAESEILATRGPR
ncbi:hypothetical protein LP414_25640 [Polaromonas sp. P1(28)-13]|nr:hypothetical protein LP416_23940 [Polaromonas sp. P2-4]UUZ78640.1 hypothetical protein LP414_25640 [Polaromonas sp. P1(28)-13]